MSLQPSLLEGMTLRDPNDVDANLQDRHPRAALVVSVWY